MNKERQEFLNLLFDLEDSTCFAHSARGTTVKKQPYESDVFFSINPLNGSQDLAPTERWHSSDKPRRADANVTKFRNFLIEMDDYPLEQQIQYVTSVYPVSSIVFSGKKSYHFIISLEQPLEDIAEYRLWARAILEGIPEADQSCKNPSRLSRLPGCIRPDTGKEQELIALRGRIPNADISNLITDRLNRSRQDILSLESKPPNKTRVSVELQMAIDKPDEYALKFGGRDNLFYWMFHRFKELNVSRDARQRFVDRAYSNLSDTRDFPLRQAYTAARIRR